MDIFLIKKIALYGVGAVTGGGIGFLVADHIATSIEELEEEERQILEETKEIIEKENYVEKKVEQPTEWIPETKTSLRKKGKAKDKPPVDYTKFTKRSLAEEVRDRIPATPDDSPYVITLEAHSQDAPNYEKRVFTYYDVDGEVCDENEALVTAPEDLIGDGLSHFGEGSGDPDTVYVRNVKLATDYEVVRIHNSYQQAVMGEKEKPIKKRTNTRKTRKVEEEGDGDE